MRWNGSNLTKSDKTSWIELNCKSAITVSWFTESHEVYSEFVLLYFADMQKFPLRMKDNDLLVTELYKDQNNDHITAISVYLTPKITSK